MEGITEIGSRHVTTVDIITIALVDDDAIRNFHDTTLDTLQFITSTRHLNQQEEVDHRVTGRLALPYSNGLYEYLVEASCLTEDDGLTGLTRHTTQGTCRRTGTDEGIRMQRQFLHTRLIAQDTTLRTL